MGMEPRYVPVPVTDALTAQVRVMSIHEDDDRLREEVYAADLFFDWCNEQYREIIGTTDPQTGDKKQGAKPTEALDKARELAKAQVERDKVVRRALALVLDKHGSDEITEIIRASSLNTLLTMFMAAKGENRRLNLLLRLTGDNPRIEALEALAAEQPTIDGLVELCRDPDKLKTLLQALNSPVDSAPTPPPS